MGFKMKGFRSKCSPLKVADYESLTEEEKKELYEQIVQEQQEVVDILLNLKLQRTRWQSGGT
jgi:1-acyl-sn-glycerol-3-phosphate acyltransferase